MDLGGASTAIMLAVATGLWFLYLMPSWMRRREYLATERNATRLQRTIRVMAESAEVPEAARLEATARDAAQAEKLLREQHRRADAVARAQLREASAQARAAEAMAARVEKVDLRPAARPAVAVAPAPDALIRLRMRRTRRVASVLLLASFVVGGVQVLLMLTSGIALGSWVVLGACTAGVILAVNVQRRLDARSVARTVVATPTQIAARPSMALSAPEVQREWTPVPVPRPRYLERGEAPRVVVTPNPDAERLLRAAAAEAERALRAAHAEPEVIAFPAAPVPVVPAAVAAPSRFANMGIIDPSAAAAPDLDEVLRRRRSAG